MLHRLAVATLQVANLVNYKCNPLEDGKHQHASASVINVLEHFYAKIKLYPLLFISFISFSLLIIVIGKFEIPRHCLCASESI